MPWFYVEYRMPYAPSWMRGVKGCEGPTRVDGVAQPEATYGALLWARSRRHARAVARRRGIGEKLSKVAVPLETPVPPSVLFSRRNRRRRSGEIAHALAWLSWLALSSGAASLEEVLGDTGVVHQAAHHLHFGRTAGSPSLAWIVEGLRRLERRVPGMVEDAG